jgi:uncharacterized protein (TIGR01777 family)
MAAHALALINPMRVLVTGGTGFIGRALVVALRDRGDEAVVVSRRREEGATWDSIDSAMDRVDAVVHLAGEPVASARWTPERLALIRASRVETTTAVAHAIERSRQKPRVLVSASAVGIYGAQGGDAPPLDEDSPVGGGLLARITAAWEAAADPVRAAGVRVVHPRVGVVLGRGGGALEKLIAPFRWWLGGPLGRGDQWVSWIHAHDAVRALLFMVDRDDVSGPVNTTAPHPLTMNGMAQAIGRAMGRPSFFRVPSVALRLALGDGLSSVVLTGQRALPGKLSAAGFSFEFPRIEEALAELL